MFCSLIGRCQNITAGGTGSCNMMMTSSYLSWGYILNYSLLEKLRLVDVLIVSLQYLFCQTNPIYHNFQSH